jgi:hypothetical protein
VAAYNTVSVKRLIPCQRCDDASMIRVQFAYGDTWQHHYELGDVIMWGGNDVGAPVEGHLEVLAYPEACPTCGLDTDGEYVLSISDGRLTEARLANAADVAWLE